MILNMIMMINFQVSQRKLSTDFVRKLSAISVASDVSCISGRFIIIIEIIITIIIVITIITVRFGMEQDQLRSIMQVRMMRRMKKKKTMMMMMKDTKKHEGSNDEDDDGIPDGHSASGHH